MSSNNSLGIQRGNYQRSLSGPLLLVLGHLACIPLQYAIVTHHPLSVLGMPQRSIDLSFWPAALPPPPPPLLVFLAMTGILVAKQSIWVFGICNEYMTVTFALFGVLADFFYEGVSALVFTAASVNPLWHPSFLYLGATVHFTAAMLELAAELQRKVFKDDTRNTGKLCATGLWSVCRHPNFALNVVYGAAYGFATGGPVFALLTGGIYVSNFVLNAVPPKEVYLAEKYGEQWERYRRVVRWKLFPGIY